VAEVGEALQISSTAPFDFVSRVVAITRLPRYNARNSARVISLNLSFTTMPPPDQGYISACTVGYTL
jgi:hypothetical protein